MLRDDPNESSAVYLLTSDNKHTVCGTNFSPMQFNFFAENISDDSSLWRRLSITCPARKKIKFHRCSFLNINVKQTTVCVFHFLNLESLKRIYPSLYTFRDFRHRRTTILKGTDIKTSKNRGKELYNV